MSIVLAPPRWAPLVARSGKRFQPGPADAIEEAGELELAVALDGVPGAPADDGLAVVRRRAFGRRAHTGDFTRDCFDVSRLTDTAGRLSLRGTGLFSGSTLTVRTWFPIFM